MKKVNFILSLVIVIYTGKSMAQEIGNPAPDFTLEVLDGGSFTLSEQTGKLVVIFAFGYNCSFCISSAPVVQENLVDAYEGHENYVVVGVDIWDGSAGAVGTFKSNTKIDIPLLLNGSSFASDYNSVQDRLYVVDEEGILIHRANSAAIGDYKNVVPIVNEKLGVISSVENSLSDELNLQVYPNPVVGNLVNLSFNLSEGGYVETRIISSDGRTVLQPVSGQYSQGVTNVSFDIGNLSAGIYFVQLNTAGEQTYRKILVD